MSTCRIRVNRDTPGSGAFEWATFGSQGETLAAGTGNLAQPPVKGSCEVVLASDLVTLERVAIPPSQQKRLGTALRYLAEELALHDPELLHVAASPGPSRDTLSLAIVERKWLAELLARLRGAGLAAASAYPESLLPALAPHAWTVVWRGAEGFARTGRSEAMALDSAPADAPPAALRLALEQARATGIAPQAIVLRPERGSAPADTQAWSAALGLAVEAGAEWHWSDPQPRPDAELLQGEFAPRRGPAPWLQRLRPAAILAAVIAALSSIAIALDWGAKARERYALVEEMRAVFRDTFGASAVVVDPPLQMSRSLAELRQQAGYAGRTDFLVLLRLFVEEMRDPVRHRVEGIAYENAVLAVTLRSAMGQEPAALAKDLRAKVLPAGYEARIEETAGAGTVVLRLSPSGGS